MKVLQEPSRHLSGLLPEVGSDLETVMVPSSDGDSCTILGTFHNFFHFRTKFQEMVYTCNVHVVLYVYEDFVFGEHDELFPGVSETKRREMACEDTGWYP